MEEVTKRMLVLLVTAVFVFSPANTSQKFCCPRRGIFVIPESCQDYHLCERLFQQRGFVYFRMSCPEGKIFDDIIKRCLWPSDSRRVCTNTVATTETSQLEIVTTETSLPEISRADTSQEFRCRRPGKFLIPESCQNYHLCRGSQRGLIYSRVSCPEGKIFDDGKKRCRLSSISRRVCTNTVGPSEAAPPEIVPTETTLQEIDRADTSQEFRCTRPGKFLIPESCQNYHLCTRSQRGLIYSRSNCPEGKIFDDIIKICLRPSISHRVCPNTVAPTEAAPPEIVTIVTVLPEIGRANTSQEFHCTRHGKFLIPESCQDYHLCRRSQRGLIYSRISCPEGEIFDDTIKSCRWPSASRRVCTNAVAPTEAAPPEIFTTENTLLEIDATEAGLSETTTTDAALPEIITNGVILPAIISTLSNCGNVQEIIPEIIKTSNEICQHITAIEDYIHKLISGIPIQIHYIRDVEHKESVTSYNTALKNAKSNVNFSRNGNYILADIKRTYGLLKTYESDFDYNYKVNAQQLKRISLLHQDTISNLTVVIKALKEDIQIKETERISNETSSTGTSSTGSKAVLDKELASKLDTLKTMEQALKMDSGHEPVFEQLEAFLEIVTKIARDVENSAKEAQSKIDEWHTTVLITSSDLKSQFVKINKVQKNLKNKTNFFKATIDKSQKNIIKFNSQKNSLTSLKSKLENKVEANLKKIANAHAAILKKTLDHKREQRKVCETKGVLETHNCTSIHDPSCEISSPLCLLYTKMYLTPLNLTEDHAEVEQLQIDIDEQNQMLNNQITKIMNQLLVIQRDIDQREAYIKEHRGKIRQIEIEQAHLSSYSDYQKQMWLAEDSALSATETIKSGLQVVECVFHTIHEGLDGMAARARTARGAGEEHEVNVLKAKNSILQYIEELHTIIDQFSDSVSPLSCL